MKNDIISAILKQYQAMAIKLSKRNIFLQIFLGRKKPVSIMVKYFEAGSVINRWQVSPDSIIETVIDAEDVIPYGSFHIEDKTVFITHRFGMLDGATCSYEIANNDGEYKLINKKYIMRS
jgi:hypothetical protein